MNEALVRQLHRCEFLENANNVVLVGGPGTGKTHIRLRGPVDTEQLKAVLAVVRA
ncbi:DNA replication protein [Acidovorax sp. MR-S7]|nr:DNA replication protein [Acidovorax sp. MR-S7]